MTAPRPEAHALSCGLYRGVRCDCRVAARLADRLDDIQPIPVDLEENAEAS